LAKQKFAVRAVRNKEDRKRPSVFLRLKTDEYFKGYALFEPDPELEDNPGYYEYYDHWDAQATQYVPCVGEKCVFCRANDNPSTRALTLWFFPDQDKKDQLKVFTMNFSTVNDITDISEEEEGVLGKHFRVKRLSDKGEYRLRPTSEKKLTQKAIKGAFKEAPELEEIVQRQAKIQMERLAALDALEEDDVDDEDEDDDDDEEETQSKSTKTKGGKKAVEEDDDEDEEDDEDEDEDEDEDDDEDEDENDEDDDEDEDEDEDDEDEDEDEEAEELTKAEFEVVKFQEKDEVFTLKNDDGKVEAWLGQDVEAPEGVKKGSKVVITAEKDDEGDWVITAISAKKSGRGRPKGSKNKK
jgi:hypothetical protein